MSRKADWVPIPLRVMIGIGFIYHGFPKLFSIEGHRGFVALLQSIGVPIPIVTAFLVGMIEFFGGIALILGAFTLMFSILLIIEMFVAMFSVHLPGGFGFINIIGMGPQGPIFGIPGIEVNLLYIAGLSTLILSGPGHWSIDRITRRKKRPRTTPAGS